MTGGTMAVQMKAVEDFEMKDVGKACIVIGVGSGTIRFVGNHAIKNEARVGVEMNKQKGKNNGTVSGFRYFVCADGYGILTIPSKVRITASADSVTMKKKNKKKRKPEIKIPPPSEADVAEVFGGFKEHKHHVNTTDMKTVKEVSVWEPTF
jgi:hypothetical protein